jgi:imidazolonepropionase-like amidohydrolase
MHVHLTDARASAIPALVANGVTGVRDMGSLLRDVDELRVRIEDGTLVGPRIVRAGPIVNGEAFGPVQLAVADTTEARAAVRTLAKVGVDFIKIHRSLTPEEFRAIVAEAKRAGLPVAGHIPMGVTAAEVSDAGVASIEHTESLLQGLSFGSMSHEQFVDTMTALFQRFARNGTYYDPTLIMYKSSADWRGFVQQPESKYVARTANARMQEAPEQYRNAPEVREGRMQLFRSAFLELVGLMRKNGVRVMTGTDLSDGRIFPGFSVHEELALLVEAGFTPNEAIQAATRVPAEFLRLQNAGTIEVGKRADLVLLSANPLEDIHNTTRIEAVVVRGQLLDRARLDALLREAERLAAEN